MIGQIGHTNILHRRAPAVVVMGRRRLWCDRKAKRGVLLAALVAHRFLPVTNKRSLMLCWLPQLMPQ